MISVTIIGLVLVLSTVSAKFNHHHHQEQRRKEQVGENSRPWLTIGTFNGQRTAHASVVIGNTIYVLGGFFYNDSGTTYYDDVQYFQIDVSNGTVLPGSLSYTSSFLNPRYQLAAAYYNGYIYLVGGSSQTELLNDVQYGYVESDGQVLQWNTSPSQLNFARAQHQLEILKTASGNVYLAAISGTIILPGNLPAPSDTIEVAEIYPNGSLGQWYVCPFHLKGGRQWPATSFVNNYLYVMGGRGNILFNEMFNDVQFAPIQDDGCPGPWATSFHQLIIPLYGHKAVVLNSDAFVIFGGSGVQENYFNNVQYATVNAPDTDTTAWTFDQYQFLYPRYGHSAVQVNNIYVYVIGGQIAPGKYSNDIQMTTISSFDT